MMSDLQGLILIDKPRGKTSFSLVSALRRLSKIKKIGHAGTLDPFATGVMVLLIGRDFTRLSDQFLGMDKEYSAKILLGKATDTFDCEGKVTEESAHVPSLAEVENALKNFQGTLLQMPPMFSAKKIQGKKLYELARKGISIEREKVSVTLKTDLIRYEYPFLELQINCSKGTYIRSVAHDLGQQLSCGGHLVELTRLRSGPFHLKDCLDGSRLNDPTLSLQPFLIKTFL